ncbi:MAG: TolC family protein [Muribaculaceae bacterium]|nr:TolC family protein [Muribaculaceae bacterium]
MIRRFLFTAILLGATTVSYAETWSYADCLNYAREHNISLQKARISEQTAGYDLEEAKAQWQPSLDFGTSHTYVNTPFSNGKTNAYNSNYGFDAGWTVWNGGVRENTIKQDKLRMEIAELNTGDILRSLETDLLQVYLNLLYAKESINIYAEAEKVSLAQADRARQLMEAGRMSRVDYTRLKSQYEQDHYFLVNAQTTYDTRRMELKKLLELGLDADINPANVEWTAEQVLASLPDIEESYRLAMATDLKIQGLELEKSSSELDEKIARAGRAPKIALNAGVGTGYYAPGESFGNSLKQALNEQIGVSLSIPILDNKKTKTAVARAKAQQLNAQLDIDQRQTELAQTVENWYIDTRSAQARFVAAQSSLESARLTDELTNEQFSLGYVNTVELMTAHNAYIEARHSLLQAKYMAMLGQKMIEFYRYAKVEL